jgi:hypothetical protein
VNRAPKGLRTRSIKSCLLEYSFEATECPSIRQSMSTANTSAMAPVPCCQASAWRMIVRLASVELDLISATDLPAIVGAHAILTGTGCEPLHSDKVSAV